MKRILIISASLILIFSGCDKVGFSGKASFSSADEMVTKAMKIISTITVQELNELMNSEEIYTLLDVRQKSEHYYGYIPGALVIPRGSIEFLIGNEQYWESEGLYMPLKDEKIILYCRKGKRAALAALALKQLGYESVMALEGGWKNWELAYPDIFEKNLEKLSGNEDEHEDIGGC
ncbi:MAG: rhodanese-like domain-containing protein [Cyclobacteriaceae bacterium]